jgi:hypothetical protein
VAWYESDAYDPDDLRVRVYTTLASSNKQVVEFARNGQNWEDPVAIANVEDVTSENSSIGVCRERTFNSGVPIFVFYKPKSSYIDLVSPQVQPALTAEAQAAYRPRGIPVSL